MNINGICNYETPCGWCSKWDKKCDKKIGCGCDSAAWTTEQVASLLNYFVANQYLCSVCGKIISPVVSFHGDQAEMNIYTAELRGGLSNSILKSNICPSCQSKLGI